jgi:hypothetical protein
MQRLHRHVGFVPHPEVAPLKPRKEKAARRRLSNSNPMIDDQGGHQSLPKGQRY